MRPVAAMWNKDYRAWTKERADKFANLLARLLGYLDANNEGDATVHDDMAVWFRNLFWTTDPRFNAAAEGIPSNLKARAWRLYTLCWAVEQAYRNDRDGAIVDIGCYDGRALEVVLRYQRWVHGVPRVFAFDLFDNVPEEARKAAHGSELRRQTAIRLAPWDAHVIAGDIRETSHHLPSRIAFAQIDLNNAEAEGHVFPLVYERLVRGGIVVFDDYGFRRYRESALTHQRFLEGKEQVLELPTGQGLLVKA